MKGTKQNQLFTKVFKKEIVWRYDADDDLFFSFRNYHLRVEEMDTSRVWFQVYFKGHELVSPENTIKQTEKQAKEEAERIFLEHYQTH